MVANEPFANDRNNDLTIALGEWLEGLSWTVTEQGRVEEPSTLDNIYCGCSGAAGITGVEQD